MLPHALQCRLGGQFFRQDQRGAANGHRSVEAGRTMDQHPLAHAQAIDHPQRFGHHLARIHPPLHFAFACPVVAGGCGLARCPAAGLIAQIKNRLDLRPLVALAAQPADE
jgi:hypothetical protein